jgi:RNA polymerase sigma-70 factor, ECF subfamily
MHSTDNGKSQRGKLPENGQNLGADPLSAATRKTPPARWVAEVFARLEVPLVAYVRRQLWGDLEAARDIVQDAFVKLCQQAWPEIEPHATAWLYRTCRNRAIDLSRREGRMSAIHTGTDVASLQDRAGHGPDHRAEQGEQLDQLRAGVGQLTDQQQEVLRLRLHDGLSYRQIAEVTGLTTTNVGYHLHQAISQLRTRLEARS